MTIKIGNVKNATLIIPVFKKEKSFEFFNEEKNGNDIKNEASHFGFEAEKNETCLIRLGNRKILLLAIAQKYSEEDLRNAYSTAFFFLKAKKEKQVQLTLPKLCEQDICAAIEGIELSDYRFDKYLSKKEKTKTEFFIAADKKYKPVIEKTVLICNNVKLVRDMVNENADVMTPKKIESIAKEFAKKNKLKIEILDEKKLQKEKLNLLYSVGKGSDNPPRLIIVEYVGNPKSKEKIALVGKGLTFDTGGLNLKPTGYIETMKLDMGGAATAYGAFKTAVELNLKKNLILVLGCAENAIDAKSYKPGDVIRSYQGKTVEIGNTDAEGRLVLADSLSYVQKKQKPTHIIDLATLTGACLVALGPSLIGIVGNDKKMKEEIFQAGEKTNDRGWELPIYDEHREMIKSKIADLKNIGGRYGGTITAGAFLEAFIEKNVKWVHLDIAGAAFAEAPRIEKYVPSHGATGTAMRMLVEYIHKN